MAHQWPTFSLATDYRNRDESTFIRVAVWGKAGEAVAEHLMKGQCIGAARRIELRSWTDDEGTRRQIWTLTADATEWLGKPKGADQPTTPEGRALAAAETGAEPL